MVLAKSKNSVGLGNSLMNDRFGKGKGSDRKKVSANKGVVRTNHATGETYVTNAAQEASWVKMRSVTEQGALDEFLATAELAGTDFTAEKMNNVKIIHADQRNPFLLSAAEERGVKRKQDARRGRLTVPRRPKWNESTTPIELDEMERAALLEWRRGLADMQENEDLLMTPFERNIEVWRQLWRVIERSDLVVQIVDARNPLMFRSADLEKYVTEVDPRKRNLLLINKADMMTDAQRGSWADYFEEQGINYKFFSAHLAKEMNDGRDAETALEQKELNQIFDNSKPQSNFVHNVRDLSLKERERSLDDDDVDDGDEDDGDELSSNEDEEANDDDDDTSSASHSDDGSIPEPINAEKVVASSRRTQILTVDELESLFLENIPIETSDDNQKPTIRKTTIGLVGYPNVGKSSTINALIGAKKVSVSATPGKTKHFQTIHLSPRVVLCDCPGLVFPNFASTKAELVCNGVLPIDQLREFTGPAGLVAHRIPRDFLEKVYGMRIVTRPIEEGGTGVPTASEMLRSYAKARGFSTTGRHGQPDESRAARYILKDYVNGKLLYCHPPPHDPEVTGDEFNKGLYDFAHLPAKRQAWLLAHQTIEHDKQQMSDFNDPSSEVKELFDEDGIPLTTAPIIPGKKSRNLDTNFFKEQARRGASGHITKQAFHAGYTAQGQAVAASQRRGKELTGRKEKMIAALEKGVDVSELSMNSKKHFKPSRKKVRQNKQGGEYDE